MAFPGMMGQGTAGLDPEQLQQVQMMKFMTSAMESCVAKGVMAGGAGFALGGVFGLFMSSMRYDTPLSPIGAEIQKLPVRQQIVTGFKEMGKASYSSAKNFGYIGAVFASTECAIEGLRAKNDLANGVAAGCLTGGFLARNAGPQAVAVGCAGFAAFSAAIDAYMRMPSNDTGSDPII